MNWKNTYDIIKEQVINKINIKNQYIYQKNINNIFDNLKITKEIKNPIKVNFDEIKNKILNVENNILDKRDYKNEVKNDFIDISILEDLKNKLVEKDKIIKYLNSEDILVEINRLKKVEIDNLDMINNINNLNKLLEKNKIELNLLKDKKVYDSDLIVKQINKEKNNIINLNKELSDKDDYINKLKNDLNYLKEDGEIYENLNKIKENYTFLLNKYEKIINKDIFIIENKSYKIKENNDDLIILEKIN